MLLGLALIAGPLLVAVVDAAIQISRLTAASQELVQEGVQSARLSQSMFADIDSLGRTVRLYQVLGDGAPSGELPHHRPAAGGPRSQLSRLLGDEATRRNLEDFAAMHNEISSAVGATHLGQHGVLEHPGAHRPSSRTWPTKSPSPAMRRSTRACWPCSNTPRARSAGCSGNPRCSRR